MKLIKKNNFDKIRIVQKSCFFYFVIITFLVSCQKEIDPVLENDFSKNTEGWFDKSSYTFKDELASKLAKNLSSSLKHNEVRDFIRKEISGKDDGLNGVIFQYIKDKPISYQNSNNERVITTFGRLVSQDVSDAQSNLRSADLFLDSLNKFYPTLHIAIPDIKENLGQDWDGSNELDVAYMPDKFAYEIESLEVFSSDGEEYSMSPYSEPDENLIVVGPNYKIVAISNEEIEALTNGRSASPRICPIMLEAAYKDSEYSYYAAQPYYDCIYGDPFPGGGGGGDDDDDDGYVDPDLCALTADRWTNNRKEHMTGFRYRSISKFRYYHGTIGDIKRHMLYVLYSDIDDLGPTAVIKTYTPSRGDLRDFNLFKPSTTRWYSTNTEIQTWDYKDHGDTYTYYWYIEGTGNTTERSLSHSTKISAEIVDGLGVDQTRSGSVKVTSKDDDQLLGNAKVEFCDDSNDGTKYNTGDSFEFQVKQLD
jgi:hypothetical protein